MKYLKTFEKFNKNIYLKDKEEKEQELNQKLGDDYVIDIVAYGDFDGLNYLINTGWDIKECDSVENLLVIALKNNQMKMLDYLLNNYADINSITLSDIIGKKDYNNPNKVSKEDIEILKLMVKKGYIFDNDDYNLIDLYFTENGKNGKNKLWEGFEPFIDWLLENYPNNYKLVKHLLSDNLKKKYYYLENINKYNL